MGWNLLFCEDSSHTSVIGKQLGENKTNRTDHSPNSVYYCWTLPLNHLIDNWTLNPAMFTMRAVKELTMDFSNC